MPGALELPRVLAAWLGANLELAGRTIRFAASDTAVRTVMSYWEELVRAYYEEAYYWEDRHTSGSGLDISEHPTTRLRKQRRPRG